MYLDTQLLGLEEGGAGEMAFLNQGWNVQGNHARYAFFLPGGKTLAYRSCQSINQ